MNTDFKQALKDLLLTFVVLAIIGSCLYPWGSP